MWAGPKEVLQKESGRRLSYIYIHCTCMEIFPAISGASGVKNWHPAGRKRVRGGE
jgi:hypothetical protein